MVDEIFVFGSNLAGRHGAGSALHAKQTFGARNGVRSGPTGQAYAIPTKDASLATLPLPQIRRYVDEFLGYAHKHPELTFRVVEIGCGLAGYAPKDIAPFFLGAPRNVHLPSAFLAELIKTDLPSKVEDLKSLRTSAQSQWERGLTAALYEISTFGRALGASLGEVSVDEAREALTKLAVEEIRKIGETR